MPNVSYSSSFLSTDVAASVSKPANEKEQDQVFGTDRLLSLPGSQCLGKDFAITDVVPSGSLPPSSSPGVPGFPSGISLISCFAFLLQSCGCCKLTEPSPGIRTYLYSQTLLTFEVFFFF